MTGIDFEQAQEASDGLGVAVYRTQSGELVMAACYLVPYAAEDVDVYKRQTCELKGCSGLTGAQEAKAPHVYDNAKDNNCNTCGSVRPLYTCLLYTSRCV